VGGSGGVDVSVGGSGGVNVSVGGSGGSDTGGKPSTPYPAPGGGGQGGGCALNADCGGGLTCCGSVCTTMSWN
jgi:hypothetical protein